ncbi:MAG: RNA polymerase sigma factor [Woeseia sp.]
MSTEEQLIELAKEGSASAFSQLVEIYQARLFRFLVLRCRTRADAEDVIQDTFINAYRYIGTFNPRWRFSTWLFRIALRNAARLSQATEVTTSDEVHDDASDPLQACIVDSDRENLWLTAKRILAADAYSAMWLRYIEDMPVREVARTLGRPMSWTKVTLMRSRRRLSAELRGSDESTVKSEAYG